MIGCQRVNSVTLGRPNFSMRNIFDFRLGFKDVWNAPPENVVLSDSYSIVYKRMQTIDLSMFLKRSWDESRSFE